ncbi:class I SAM-dependent methyltransferase [Salinimicrobium xinjiangense]|uniref:class I SAM-dependent methyltransferase n=1 Tax=Salinimicrobium xinjiangense TaxID=438596 RepID=UPI000413E600|nr:class I SAM-dependent methyltransferase [Salinimicrobium xinjiangense]
MIDLKKNIQKLISRYKSLPFLKKDFERIKLEIDDIYSFQLLQPLLVNNRYLPLNGGAMRPMGIAYILNEILINNRKNILEFGAGISTILIARLIKKNNLGIQLHTIEHNKEWIIDLQRMLEDEGLSDHVVFIHSDLKVDSNIENCKWYDENLLIKKLEKMFFDLVIIDGPPADIPKISFSRYPIINFIEKRLEKDFCIFLDDANRIGERKLVQDLKILFPKNKSSHISKTFFVTYSDLNFNPIPLHYILPKSS